MQMAVEQPGSGPKKRSPWPWAIVGGLGLVFVANGIILYLGTTRPPVMETNEYYERSITHQTVIDARAASRALGWKATVDGDLKGITYVLTDAQGQPVTGLKGEVTFRRNETNTLDTPAPISETKPGTYLVVPPHAKEGLWRLEARFEGGSAPWLDEQTLRL